MNSIFKILVTSRMFQIWLVILVMPIMLGSCRKDSASGSGGEPKLVINVGGIVAPVQPNPIKASSAIELEGISSSNTNVKPSIKVGQFSMDLQLLRKIWI